MRKFGVLFLTAVAVGFSGELSPSSISTEPPLYSLWLGGRQEIDQNPFVLHALLVPGITNPQGERYFTPKDDGLIVNVPGLYRISYFQMVGTSDPGVQLYLSLDRVTSNSCDQLRQYYKTLAAAEVSEIQLTQIARLNAGDKLKLTISSYKGTTVLTSGMNVSGLTIEPLGN